MNRTAYEFHDSAKVWVEKTPNALFVYLDAMTDPILCVDLFYRSKEAEKLPKAGLTQVVLYSPSQTDDPLAYATVDQAGRMVIEPEFGSEGEKIFREDYEEELR